METDRERFVVEETSGRLLQYQTTEENAGVILAFDPDGFSRRWKASRPVAEDVPNAYDAGRPVSSFLEFVTDAVSAVPEAWRTEPWIQSGCRNMPMFRSLLERGVLQDIDAFVVTWRRETPIHLSIPSDAPGPSTWLGAIAGSFAFLAADKCFPRGSWAWTVGRETAFASAGEAKYLEPTLQQFYRDEQLGPLGALVVSWLVEGLDPRLSSRFAIRGLRDTSVDGFRRDFLPLLDEDVLLGKILARMAIVLHEVDEPTVAGWIGNLPATDRAWLVAAVDQLRQQRRQPVDVAITLALEQAWQAGLRARVVAALAARRGQDAFPEPIEGN